MKIDQILNDLTLSGLSLVLLLVWGAAKLRLYSFSRLDAETLAATVLRQACGWLLLGASLDKVGDAAGFLGLIKQCYFYIPDPLQPLTAVVIPWLEFFTGLSLIFGFRWRGAALVFTGLMAVYTLAISWDVLHDIDCSCGCFTKNAGEKMTSLTILRDLFFFSMGWILLKAPKTYYPLDEIKVSGPLS